MVEDRRKERQEEVFRGRKRRMVEYREERETSYKGRIGIRQAW